MKNLIHHLRSFKNAASIIITRPFEHLINILVLVLIITICALTLSINNSLNVWQHKNINYPQIMLYVDQNANQADILNIETILNKLTNTSIRNYQFISKKEGLQELESDQKLKQIASDIIDENNNPLPDIFLISTNTTDSKNLEHLNLKLGQIPMVDSVSINLSYANKIQELINFTNKASLFIQTLFIIVLGLVVYNMIRLQMLLKSDAILVSRLIGASDRFIMRALIHYALWQISLASIFSALLLYKCEDMLNTIFTNFSNLFGKQFQLIHLPIMEFAIMWAVLAVFTILSVFLAVRWIFMNIDTNQ